MASHQRGIVTPEGVVLDFDTAGIASRGVARLLDALIQAALLLGLALLAANLPGLAGTVVAIVGVAFVVLGYPVACEAFTRGRSPGKAALGLRVVTVEGGPEAPRHAFIRSTLGLIDFFLPPGGLFAVGSALLSARGQRFGDLVAGTMVIRERSAARPAVAVWFSAPPGLEGYAHTLDVSAVTDAQFGVVRAFLLRVHELSVEARVALALRLARPLALAMHHAVPPGVNPEIFLVCVASAHQRRHQSTSGPVSMAAPILPPPPPFYAPPPPPPPDPLGSDGPSDVVTPS